MKNIVFLDTETTGNDIFSDRLFEVAYKYDGKMHQEYFRPAIPISIKSQSITHVTNEVVGKKGFFASSKMATHLNNLFETNILVAHNAVFDIQMLYHDNVKVNDYICTLKVARFLDSESEIPEYNLQYLRYYFGFKINNSSSHDAKSDVEVLEALFEYQFKEMKKIYETEEEVIKKMIEVSGQPSLFKVFKFGKHKGRKIEEIVSLDRPYMEWLLEQKLQNNPDDEDWIFTLKFFLKV